MQFYFVRFQLWSNYNDKKSYRNSHQRGGVIGYRSLLESRGNGARGPIYREVLRGQMGD
jgi:hypothetical protein